MVESAEETAAKETGESGFGKIEPVEKVSLVQQDDTYNHKRWIVQFICMLENFMTFARTLSRILSPRTSRSLKSSRQIFG